MMRKVWIHVLLICGAIIMMTPFIWMISTSLKTYAESMQVPPTLLPGSFLIENYIDVFESADFMTYYINTIIVTVLRTGAQLLLCSMAAFAFARLTFPFKNTLFIAMLSVLMVPIQVILIPNYAIMTQLGWIDTFYALIVPGIFSAFGVFLLRQFFYGDSERTGRGCHYRWLQFMGSLLAHHPTECKASSRSFRDFYRSRLMERFFVASSHDQLGGNARTFCRDC